MNTEHSKAKQPDQDKPGIRKSAARKPTTELSGVVSCLLAFCLILTGSVWEAFPVYASQISQEAQTKEITFLPEDGATADSEVTGHIKVELLSVEMPAGDLEFEVDTTAPFQVDSPGEQIRSPGIAIRNRSVVPVKLEISNVAKIRSEDVHFSEKFNTASAQSFQLVDKLSEVGPPGTAILVLGLAGKEYSQAAFEKDAIIPDKKNIFLTDIPAEEERVLELYGKVAPDFYGAYQFTVRPTLKISAVQATQG